MRATRIGPTGSRRFELTPSEALRLFDLLVDWQPRQEILDLDRYNVGIERAAGDAFASAVLPFVDLSSLGVERVEKYLAIAEGGTLRSAVIGLPELVRIDPSRENRAIEVIYGSILGSQAEAVEYGLLAIEAWRTLSGTGAIAKVPQRLKQAVLTTVIGARGKGLHLGLYIASRFLDDVRFATTMISTRWQTH